MLKSFGRMAMVLSVVIGAVSSADAAIFITGSFNSGRPAGLNPSDSQRLDLANGSTTGNANNPNNSDSNFSTLNGGLFGFNVPAIGTLVTYCIEIPQNITLGTGPYTYQVDIFPDPALIGNLGGAHVPNPGAQMDSTQAGWIQKLYNQFYTAALGGKLSLVGGSDVSPATYAAMLTTVLGTTNQADIEAAFQLALWKIEYDETQVAGGLATNGSDFNNGFLDASFATTNSVVAAAIKMVNFAVSGTVNSGYTYQIFSLSNGTSPQLPGNAGLKAQDQLIAYVGNVPPLIKGTPEPGSLIVWGVLGLVGIGFARRKARA